MKRCKRAQWLACQNVPECVRCVKQPAQIRFWTFLRASKVFRNLAELGYPRQTVSKMIHMYQKVSTNIGSSRKHTVLGVCQNVSNSNKKGRASKAFDTVSKSVKERIKKRKIASKRVKKRVRKCHKVSKCVKTNRKMSGLKRYDNSACQNVSERVKNSVRVKKFKYV